MNACMLLGGWTQRQELCLKVVPAPKATSWKRRQQQLEGGSQGTTGTLEPDASGNPCSGVLLLKINSSHLHIASVVFINFVYTFLSSPYLWVSVWSHNILYISFCSQETEKWLRPPAFCDSSICIYELGDVFDATFHFTLLFCFIYSLPLGILLIPLFL